MFIVEVGVSVDERGEEMVFLVVVSRNITHLRAKSVAVQLTCTSSR